MTCAHCGRGVLPASRWRRATADERAAWKRDNLSRMAGRGLCGACYPKHKDDYDPRNRSVDETLAEWEWLADPLVPLRAEALRLAPQLGLAPHRLETIVSTNIGSRFEGGHGERLKAS